MSIIKNKQYICDTCYELIKSPEDACIEWQVQDQEGKLEASKFTIVHNLYCSPRQVSCLATNHGRANICSIPLLWFLGLKEKLPLIDILRNSKQTIKDVNGFVEFRRRLEIPFYEEARLYMGKLKPYLTTQSTGEQIEFFEPGNLKLLINEYGLGEFSAKEISRLLDM